MEWTESIRRTIDYLEEHLLEEPDAYVLAKEVGVASFYLQRGFKIMTGYALSEYQRSRRLYLAGLEVIAGQAKIIDLAYKYGYDTPESFTKAFTRFHGRSPLQLKKDPSTIRVFLPLKIKIVIQGGNHMDYVIEKMQGFQVIGYQREFHFEDSYKEIPEFWGEVFQNKILPLYAKSQPEHLEEEVIARCHIGEFGICVDDLNKDQSFRYLIAGRYQGEQVPEGMTVYEFPEAEWAKFTCVGPLPGALQSVNTKIFNEWLPGNPEYEIAFGANVEWYSAKGNTTDADYESAIWIPVKKK